jgi:hypothetical protein
MHIGKPIRHLLVEPVGQPSPRLNDWFKYYSEQFQKRCLVEGIASSVPDAASPVTGWRAWKLFAEQWHTPQQGAVAIKKRPVWRLQSVNPAGYGADLWQYRKPLEAACRRQECTVVPSLECTCGIFAFRSELGIASLPEEPIGPQLTVIGQVIGWGNVIEHDHGWRAQLAYPKTLAVICSECRVKGRRLKRAAYVAIWRAGNVHPFGLCRRHAASWRKRRPVGSGQCLMSTRAIEKQLVARYSAKDVGIIAIDHGYGIVCDVAETHSAAL